MITWISLDNAHGPEPRPSDNAHGPELTRCGSDEVILSRSAPVPMTAHHKPNPSVVITIRLCSAVGQRKPDPSVVITRKVSDGTVTTMCLVWR